MLTRVRVPGAAARNFSMDLYIDMDIDTGRGSRVQELCESRGGRPGLSVLMSPTVSVEVKQR